MGEHDRAIASSQRVRALAAASGDFALQVGAHYYLGMAYYTRGVYRQSIDCCRWLVAALTGAQRQQRFGHQVLPAVVARYNLSRVLSEMGAFAEGMALGAEGLRIAE